MHRARVKCSSALRLVPAIVTAAWLASSTAYASVLLPPGGVVALPGSTAAAEADLTGVVIHDQLIPFQITGANGALLCRGRLQDRVVRSNRTRLLHFYYRIRDTATTVALPGIISRVETIPFSGFDPLRVDWRPDGLGVVAPRLARRNAAPGPLVEFDFREPLLKCSGPESRFFFIKTNAKAFGPEGKTRLVLTTGQNVVLPTVRPVP